ncbi:MAG: DNA repair exonuclease [Pseudomonadota bacterium]
MRFRFVHTADLHLDSPLAARALRDPPLAARIGAATRTALERIVALCLETEADALLIAGDLYDGALRSMKTAAFLTRAFERLGEAGIRVFLIRGNHDAASAITKRLSLPETVHVFGGRGGTVSLAEQGVAIHGVSFRQPHAPESLLPKLPPPTPGLFNIGMLHTSLGGAPGHDPYAPCSVAELVAHGYDYWALGHIHARTVHHEAPWVVMPGMPQGRDIGEAGEKSVTLATVEDGVAALEEHVVSPVVFRRRSHPVVAEDWAGLRTELRAALEAERAAEAETVLRLRLTGATPLAFRLRRDRAFLEAELAEWAGETPGLAIDRLELDIAPPTAPAEGDPLSEVAGLMEEIASDPGFRAEAAAFLARMVEDLPPDLRDRYGEDADGQAAALDRLLAAGQADVLAALAGRPSETPD